MAGDRKCYQLPPGAKGLARRAINRDALEGADILMVKPALPYLDVIQDCAQLQPDLPTACYQVSGEFAMIHAGARAGVYDLRQMAEETVGSMMRAGELSDRRAKHSAALGHRGNVVADLACLLASRRVHHSHIFHPRLPRLARPRTLAPLRSRISDDKAYLGIDGTSRGP